MRIKRNSLIVFTGMLICILAFGSLPSCSPNMVAPPKKSQKKTSMSNWKNPKKVNPTCFLLQQEKDGKEIIGNFLYTDDLK
jgi:hypothetical protein